MVLTEAQKLNCSTIVDTRLGVAVALPCNMGCMLRGM